MQIVTGDVGVDFLHQLADAAERPAPNCLLGDEAEPALHLIEPTGIGRSVMDVVARPARQPGLNLGMLGCRSCPPPGECRARPGRCGRGD